MFIKLVLKITKTLKLRNTNENGINFKGNDYKLPWYPTCESTLPNSSPNSLKLKSPF